MIPGEDGVGVAGKKAVVEAGINGVGEGDELLIGGHQILKSVRVHGMPHK
jgi:hypothetical protein